jgi:hypothetical protein
MPTTVIPGVTVEVHLYGAGDDHLIEPKGSRVVAPYGDTTYAVSLQTRRASRQLGTLDLAVDFGACTSRVDPANWFTAGVVNEANKAFPPGEEVWVRENPGVSVDIGYNSFVVDIPLKVEVEDWFNPDVDVALGFSVSSQNGQVRVTHDLATTYVSFGTLSTAISHGCSVLVEKALERQSNGFLSGCHGPVIAEQIKNALTVRLNDMLDGLNRTVPPPPVPYRIYDLTLTAGGGLTYRFCPARPSPVQQRVRERSGRGHR